MTQNKTQLPDSDYFENQEKARILLALWDLGGTQREVKKGLLSKRVVGKGKRIADYQKTFERLEQQGAIAISKQGYTLLSPTGLEVLSETLRSAGFQFAGTIVGTWVANSLVKWINQMDGAVVSTSALVSNHPGIAIQFYSEFETVATQVYEKLNREYNFNHLVPIYRIRREIGDRVSRSDFNEWLLEMQANDIFLLEGGSVEDSAPDKIEDSVSTELDGLRCYASRLQS